MKIAVLGTGIVGRTIANKLIALGHEVCMGSRSASSPDALAWKGTAGSRASVATFRDAASFGELAFLCTSGAGTVDAAKSIGDDAVAGKVVIDLTNPLDFSKGMPPRLFIQGDDSLGEQVQRALPSARVVKTLNTINTEIMVDAGRIPGDHDVFMCGDDASAKSRVGEMLRAWFGWKSVVDLGPLRASRGTEAYVLFWVHTWGALGTADFNVKLVRRPA